MIKEITWIITSVIFTAIGDPFNVFRFEIFYFNPTGGWVVGGDKAVLLPLNIQTNLTLGEIVIYYRKKNRTCHFVNNIIKKQKGNRYGS